MLSAQELYKDYNRRLLPASETVIGSGTAYGVPYTRLYFSGEQCGRGLTRVYAVLYTAAGVDSPVIVLLPDLFRCIDELDVSKFTSAGYSVLCVDYAGEKEERERFTLYPKGQEHCNYFRHPEAAAAVCDSPAQSCWFTWGTVAHRAVAFLEEKGYENIALLGMGCGGTQILKVLPFAGGTVKCGAILFSDPVWGKNVDKTKDFYYNFVACLSPAAFAPFVDVPLFVQAVSNEADGGVDKLCEIASNCSTAYFSVSPRAFGAPADTQKNNILNFFELCMRRGSLTTKTVDAPAAAPFSDTDESARPRRALYLDGMPALAPALKFKPSAEALYVEVHADDALSCMLYYCHGSSLISRYRNWHCLKPESISADAYLAKPTVYNADEFLHVFANVTLSCGLSVSTLLAGVSPAALGVKSKAAALSRLIYEADMGVDDWLVLADEASGSLFMVEDELGIKGVSGTTNSLATFKLAEDDFAGAQDLSLSMTVKARSPLTVSVVDKHSVRRCCLKCVPTSEKWQKAVFLPEDFKADGIALASWRDVLSFEITGDAVINSLLWV